MKQHFFHTYPAINNALGKVNQTINDRITIKNPQLHDALQQMASNGGKYLRPAFFFLFANINHQTANEQEKLIKIASSLEVLHMATLIHDDIIDNAKIRRGKETIPVSYINKYQKTKSENKTFKEKQT